MPNGWPSFARTDEGQEIAMLHLLGYPLATTQQELTETQRLFLLYAVPEAHRRANEQAPAPAGKPTPKRGDMTRLRQQMELRQKGG